MKKSFVSCGCVLVAVSSLVLFAFVPRDLYAREAQESSKTPGDKATVSQTEAQHSKETGGNRKGNSYKDAEILTKEYAAMSGERPKLQIKSDVASGSFTRELYQVEWRAKDPFDLYVIRPKGVAKPPVIIYLPTFPDDTEQFKNNAWCETAVHGGYAAVGFVGALTGHRTRYRLMEEWFVSEMPEALTSTTHDVQLILDYLGSRGDLDMDRVAMYGMGSGGSIAVLASVVDPRIKALYLVGPWGDWEDWLKGTVVIPEEERAKYIEPQFVAKVSPLDPVKWLTRIQAKSMCIEDIRGNKSMPDKAQEKLEGAAPDFALINQYGNGRAFLGTQVPITTLQWVKSQLAPDAGPQVAMEKSARVHFFPAVEAPAQNWPNVAAPKVAKVPASANEKEKDKEKEKENPR